MNQRALPLVAPYLSGVGRILVPSDRVPEAVPQRGRDAEAFGLVYFKKQDECEGIPDSRIWVTVTPAEPRIPTS